jgi:hypothetical protein
MTPYILANECYHLGLLHGRRWRQQVLSKRQYLSIKVHDVTFKRNANLTLTAVRTRDVTRGGVHSSD